MLEAIAEAESTGFAEQQARALNNLGGFGLAPPHHAFADTYLPQAIEFRSAQRGSVAHQRPGLRRAQRPGPGSLGGSGRFRRVSPARSTRVTLAAPRSAHRARARACTAWRSGGDDALDEAERVGVPAEDLGAQLDLASARAEVAWLEQRAGDLDERPRVCLRALAAAELRPVAREYRSRACSPVSRSRPRSMPPAPMRSRSPAGGRTRPPSGALRLPLRGCAGADRDERRGARSGRRSRPCRSSGLCPPRGMPPADCVPSASGGHAGAAEGDT